MKNTFGIDIGNVIINFSLSEKNAPSQSQEAYSKIPAINNSFDTIKKLHELFEGRIFLISKCKESNENKIISWLNDNDFHSKTGVDKKNIYFCRERSEKAIICKNLEITHFIDNRIEVLIHMLDIVPNLFLYKQKPNTLIGYEKFLTKIIQIDNWKNVIAFIK